MLFDTSSPGRKRVVRILFGGLALIFGISFVGFGIGGELGGGGIIDAITGNNSGAAADQFEQQIEDAEQAVEDDPEDARALAELALLRFQSGEAQLEIDEQTGQVTGLTEESRSEFEAAIEAWSRYVDTDPAKLEAAAAARVVSAYRYLEDVNGAVRAQELLTESDPSSVNLAGLADLRYRALEIKAADEARDRALAKAKQDQAKALERQLNEIRKQALAVKKAEAKQPDVPGGEGAGLEDPFGGLGQTDPGAGGLTPP